jgi:hypothetical protein
MDSLNFNEIKGIKIYKAQGTQAYIFHDRKYAYKIYKNNMKNHIILNTIDMDYQLERLSRINLDSYVTPKFNLTDSRGFFIGYGMDYIKGNTINELNVRVNIDKFIDDLKKLEEDTYCLSENRFQLRDRNDRNVIYTKNDGFKLIDLDNGIFLDDKSIDELNKENLLFIKKMIETSVFGLDLFDKKYSYDDELADCLSSNESLTDFIEYLEKSIKKEKILIKDIRKRKEDLIIVKDYYGHY